MASEYSVKKANHREQMQRLDQSHQRQVNRNKNEHRETMEELRARHALEKKQLQNEQHHQLERMKLQNDRFVKNEKLTHQARIQKQNLQAQRDYQQAAHKKKQENLKLKLQSQSEKDHYINTRDQYRKKTMEAKAEREQQLEHIDKEGRFLARKKQSQNQERLHSLQKAYNSEVQRIEQHGQENIKERRDKYKQTEALTS